MSPPPTLWFRARALTAFPRVLAACGRAWGVTVAKIGGGSRWRVVAHARAAAGFIGVTELGLPIAQVPRALGVSPPIVRVALSFPDPGGSL